MKRRGTFKRIIHNPSHRTLIIPTLNTHTQNNKKTKTKNKQTNKNNNNNKKKKKKKKIIFQNKLSCTSHMYSKDISQNYDTAANKML